MHLNGLIEALNCGEVYDFVPSIEQVEVLF